MCVCAGEYEHINVPNAVYIFACLALRVGSET